MNLNAGHRLVGKQPMRRMFTNSKITATTMNVNDNITVVPAVCGFAAMILFKFTMSIAVEQSLVNCWACAYVVIITYRKPQ